MRDLICLVLATMLFGYSTLEARVSASGAVPPGQAESKAKPTVKERILEIPSGTIVEVRLLNKQKLRGRLGEITDEGIALQTAQGNKIETRKIAFNDLKSFKRVQESKAGRTVGWAVVGVLAGLGVVALVFAARMD